MENLNFNDLKNKLTQDDINQILAIVSYRCRTKTTNRLRSILTYGTSSIGNFGIFDRLIKENNRWDYIIGQSYTDEIRTLRECILGKIY